MPTLSNCAVPFYPNGGRSPGGDGGNLRLMSGASSEFIGATYGRGFPIVLLYHLWYMTRMRQRSAPLCPAASRRSCNAERSMDPLHATIEAFAVEGFTHIECYCPSMPHDEVKANRLAAAHLFGPDHRAVISTAALRGMRWPATLGQTVAIGECASKPLGRRG